MRAVMRKMYFAILLAALAACDLVLAARSSRFGYPEVKIGFVPAMVMASGEMPARRQKLSTGR